MLIEKKDLSHILRELDDIKEYSNVAESLAESLNWHVGEINSKAFKLIGLIENTFSSSKDKTTEFKDDAVIPF